MGNNCNTGPVDYTFHTTPIPSNRGGSTTNLGCMGCIPNPQGSHMAIDHAEILTHNHEMVPMGKISMSSIAFLQKEEIGFLKACAGKNVSALRYYTKNGANVNLLDEDRTSALHVACRSGSIQVVEELVNLGATVNMADMAGWTSLHVAAYYQRPLICHVLLKNGADPYLASRQGETPWDFVKDKSTEEVFFSHLDRTGIRKHMTINTHRKDEIPVEINDENALSPLQKPKEHTFRTKYELELRDSFQNRDGTPDFFNGNYSAQKAIDHNIRNSTAMSSYRRALNAQNKLHQEEEEFYQNENMLNNNNCPKKHKYFLYFKRIKAQHMASFQENKDVLRTLNSEESDEEREESMFDYSMGNDIAHSPSNVKSSAKLGGDNGFDEFKAVKSKADSFLAISRNQSPEHKKSTKGLPPMIPGRSQRINQQQQQQQVPSHLLHPSLNHPSINNSFTKVSSMSRIDRTNLSFIPLNNPNLSVYRLFFKDPSDVAVTKLDNESALNDHLTVNDMAQFNVDEKYSDMIYKMGLELFNYDGLMGISFQLLFKFLRPSLKDIACFLFVEETRVTVKRSIQEVTNFLTNNQLKESLSILKNYSNYFHFENNTFVEALKLYLSNFVIENDPEKIDWLLRGFAKRFFRLFRSGKPSNAAPKHPIFETVETVRMLAFTTVMLDIELNHSDDKGMKSKTQLTNIKKEFNNNLMGINDGENFSTEFINSIFEEVKKTKVITHMGFEGGNPKAKLFFKSIKLVAKASRNSRKQKGVKKEYLMYFSGPICFMVKFLGDVSVPKGVFMLDNCNFVAGKSKEIKFVPKKTKVNNTLQIAKFMSNGTVMISSKQDISLTLVNEVDSERIQAHMSTI